MKRALQLTLIAAVTASLTGCGSNPYAELLPKWAAHVTEVATILADVKDEGTARDALPKLRASLDAHAAVVKEFNQKLGPNSKAGKAAVPESALEVFEQAGRKFRSQRDRIQAGLPEAWKILEPMMDEMRGVKSPAERVRDGMLGK